MSNAKKSAGGRWLAAIIGVLSVGVTSCGGGGGGGGGSGGGSMTITPQAPNTVAVRTTDSCNDNADIEWRIFGYDTAPANARPTGILPSSDRVYITPGLDVQPSAELVNCGTHLSVCYGGRVRGDTGSGRYWGGRH